MIRKMNLYVNDDQYEKLLILAEQKGVEPEQIANEAVYGYLAIVDPFAIDYDDMTPEQQKEEDRKYYEWCKEEGLDPHLDPEEENELLLYDPLDPNVEVDDEGYRI